MKCLLKILFFNGQNRVRGQRYMIPHINLKILPPAPPFTLVLKVRHLPLLRCYFQSTFPQGTSVSVLHYFNEKKFTLDILQMDYSATVTSTISWFILNSTFIFNCLDNVSCKPFFESSSLKFPQSKIHE